jgi:large subunit ribosomal protein L30
MLRKIQHYVSWQEIDVETVKELLDKKARKSGYKKVTSEDITAVGFTCYLFVARFSGFFI